MVSLSTRVFLALGFSVTTGYIDVIVLIRYSVFASMMTGNLLSLGKSLVEEAIDPWYVILIIFCRMFGSALHTAAEHRFNYGGTLLTPMVIVLISAVEVTHYIRCYTMDLEPLYPRKYEVCFIAVIFGIQEAVSQAGCLKIITTMVTGHMQSVTTAITSKVYGKKVNQEKVFMDVLVILGLAAGACMGSLINTHTAGSLFSEFLLSPAILIVAVLVVVDDQLGSPSEKGSSSMFKRLLSHADMEKEVVDPKSAPQTDLSNWFPKDVMLTSS